MSVKDDMDEVSEVLTPNIMRIAHEGISFSRAFSGVSTEPTRNDDRSFFLSALFCDVFFWK